MISWLFIILYSLGYVHISNSGLKNVYVKNSFDNLIKFFVFNKMYGCVCIIHRNEGNKHRLCILCSIAEYLINIST